MAVAGERVFYNATVNSSGILALLQGPSGHVFFNQNAANQIGPEILTEPGTYTLVIYGSGATTGAYGFDLLQAAIPIAPLTLGTPISGTLVNPGDQAAYTFTGTAGQRLLYDALIPSDGTLEVEVVSPDGAVLTNEGAFNDSGFTLPQPGSYTVVVYGAGAATGQFSFQLSDVAAAPTMPLGTPVTGTLDPGLSDAVYQFAGTAGQVVYFQALGTDNTGRWDLYSNATNPTEVTGAGLANDFQATLPATGTYLLVLTGQQSSGAAVNYSFQVLAPALTTTALNLGVPNQGNVAQPGASTTYTFLGAVGQRILYDALQASTPNLFATLVSPSGATVFSNNSAQSNSAPLTLAEAGTYRLTIAGAGGATGTYAFQVEAIAAATPLTLGTSISGTLNPGLAAGLYSYSGTAGQRLSFLSQSLPGASGTWTLYGPEDQFIAGNVPLSSNFTANLTETGAYVLVLSGQNASAPVNYQFKVSDISDTPVSSSGFGTVQSGTIAAAQTVPITFAAPAGLPIYFDGQTGTGSLNATLRDPSGNVVFSVAATSNAGPYILSASGNYVLTISGTSPSATGTYQFQVLDLKDGGAPLTLGTPVSGTLNPGTAATSYSLSVPVGQRVVFNALTTASSGIQANLYSAGGTQVFSTNANNDNGPITLLAGSYYLILVGSQPATAAYNLSLLDATAPPALPLDTGPISGTLNPGTSATLFRISGFAGEHLYLDGVSFSGSGTWAIYNTGNQVIAQTNFNSDLTATLPTTGTYVLALYGADTSGPVSYDFTAHLVNNVTNPISSAATPSGTTTFTYDPTFNEVASETDPLGRVTDYTYDSRGNVLTETQVVGSGGTNNLVTTFSYNSLGLVTKKVDPAGLETDYTYDALGRLTKVTTGAGTPDQASVELTYDAAGNVLTTTNGDSQTTTNTYDVMDRRLTTTDPLGNTITDTYDAAGNVVAFRDAAGHVTTYAYNPYGNVIKETDANGDVTLSTYDAVGNLTSVTDPLGNVTRYQYDARGRLIATIDPAGDATHTIYDSNNNVLTVIDPDGNETNYSYDGLNRLVRVTDALGNPTVYTYDADGEIVSETDANGQVINNTYNGVGLLTSQAWQGTSEVINTAYNADGQVTSVSDPSSSLTYTYDGQGRVKTVDNAGTPGAPHVVLTYTYDAAGNVLSLADSVNGQAEGLNSYTYNAGNQQTQVVQTGAALEGKQVDFTYNPVGQFATINRYSDAAGTQLVASSTYSYNTLNELTSLVDSQGATTLASYALSYNANSLITKIVDPDGTASYTYDSLGQLTGATDSSTTIPGESYTYDASGNRLTSGTSSASTVGGNNQLLSDGTYDYQYDNQGNLILRTTISSGATESYTYDARNRLITVIDKNAAGQQTQEVENTYDVLNRRISESVTTAAGTTVTDFVYAGNSILLEFQSSSGSQSPVLTDHNLFGPAVDQILAQDDGRRKTHVSWLLADYLGSIRDVVNSAGTEVDHLVYNSSGDLLSQTNPAAAPGYQFAGQEFDSATGLYDDGARYYNPTTGRFLTEDPIGFASGQANLYTYAGNDPVGFTDPTGLQAAGQPRRGFPSGPESTWVATPSLPTFRPHFLRTIPTPRQHLPRTIPTFRRSFLRIIQEAPCSLREPT